MLCPRTAEDASLSELQGSGLRAQGQSLHLIGLVYSAALDAALYHMSFFPHLEGVVTGLVLIWDPDYQLYITIPIRSGDETTIWDGLSNDVSSSKYVYTNIVSTKPRSFDVHIYDDISFGRSHGHNYQ